MHDSKIFMRFFGDFVLASDVSSSHRAEHIEISGWGSMPDVLIKKASRQLSRL